MHRDHLKGLILKKCMWKRVWACVCACVCVCVKPVVSYGYFTIIQLEQGAIPLIIGGWPTKRPMMRAANVPAGSSWVWEDIQLECHLRCSTMIDIPWPEVLLFSSTKNLSSVFWVCALTCEHRRSASCESRSGHRPLRWIMECPIGRMDPFEETHLGERRRTEFRIYTC